MRDPSARRWHRWRFALRRETSTELVNRLLTPVATPADATEPEQPGPDGIRHELVARVRREIAAGTYDTEEKWLAAEAALLRRIEERM